jgi:hypothetical protein
LRSRQLFQLNQSEDGRRSDSKSISGFTHRDLIPILPFSLSISWNRMAITQCADDLCSPAFSMCCAVFVLIQDRSDSCIRFDARQLANHFYKFMVSRIAMLSGVKLWKFYLRVISALPVQYKPYRLFLAGGRDLLQRDAKKAFLVLRRTARIVP